MKFESIVSDHRPRCYVALDVESAVLDETAHKRYQHMERWTPQPNNQHSRRGYKRSEDPLQTPRWPFQTIVTASIMLLVEHSDGNVEVSRFVTLSAAEHSERAIVEGVLRVLADTPIGAELVSWGGAWHDLPLLTLGAMKHGLSLPRDWSWMAWGGEGRVRHIDFARVLTGGSKMKPVHMAEYAAALNIPAKLSAAPYLVSKLIAVGEFELVEEICEGDVITTALLLAHWRRLIDQRADLHTAIDRLLRQIQHLRAGRGYIAALEAHRTALFHERVGEAELAAERFAPWLSSAAAA